LFLDSSDLFDQLGAKDIFKRFNNFLESWKYWQDDERQCKEMLGFDLEMKLVESLCIIPSGNIPEPPPLYKDFQRNIKCIITFGPASRYPADQLVHY
jgi:hypothetical protein